MFSTHAAFKRASWLFKKPLLTSVGKRSFQAYEANIDPMLRFCHVQDIRPAGWVKALHFRTVPVASSQTYTDVEINVTDRTHLVYSPNESIAPIVQASFDIETYSHDGSFPDPHDKGCPCIQIATVLQRMGEPAPYRKHLISFGTCDPIDGTDVVQCSSELEVLNTWAELVRSEGVDILIGYNIWGFDLHYLWTRAALVNADSFFELSKVRGLRSTCTPAAFSSGAYGDSDYQMVTSIGRFQLDLLVVMKREHKLTSYSLNSVSAHFLNDNKIDMPFSLMFQKWRGSSADRSDIAAYCLKDSELPLDLTNKLAIVPNMFEMAKATWVPLSFLTERGQGIKVFSQILYQTRLDNMLVVSLNRDKPSNEAPYEGATVLDALSGAYMDDPITGLDFASLYPTIMRAHNLCHSTIVLDPAFDNIPGVEYFDIDSFRFAQSNEGILPKMLRILSENRKKAKHDMAAASERGDSFMYSVFNGKQLAFKVSMNSIYGFCGALVGFLPCKPVASCTTSIGRNMISHTKSLVEQWYPGSTVVYGDTDSVMVKFDNGSLKGKDALVSSFALGKEAAQRISATFKYPIELEFEKVYLPYLLFSKKRYAGLMYTNPRNHDYIDAKGIQLVRRDNCPFVKRTSQAVLNSIMFDRCLSHAIQIVKDAAACLLNNRVPIDDLVVSKSIKRISFHKHLSDIPSGFKSVSCGAFFLAHQYANPNLPHINVARLREQRFPGSGPKSGDRVPFVFVLTDNPHDLQFLKAEDPSFAKLHDLPIDSLYYLHHGLKNPLLSLFSLFLPDPEFTLFHDALVSHSSKINSQIDILSFLNLPS